MEIKVGDVVRLKSGSPIMTVEKVTGNLVDVVYYENNTFYFRSLLITSLDLLIPDKGE